MKYDIWHKVSILFFGIVFLSSCDCVQQVKGVVVDKVTDKPIADVLVRKEHGSEREMKTDSTGEFKLSAISGGVFGCPAMDISAFKQGYKIATATVPAGGEIKIELEK
ncbi:carboxypeptidase-like regulatory domain-containing protein [Mucilaginibacter ginsenosidivorax]|uniref:Carboxypeptidase regulatory-like domain-containing protein n=1 Tax=Mucilaginibacter ginsenosidivorax TaxID=862126 RepID=A0A5B8W6V2_9SPHI|nr:carboxypeptidase-like regulatory domain-containing protein [Mucilaginibacter ginsenosidivorax]QEC79441.1 carboxypeptidase regulatory-like domain-containing protein [Mucilaginibacter ginsenosidivorax]